MACNVGSGPSAAAFPPPSANRSDGRQAGNAPWCVWACGKRFSSEFLQLSETILTAHPPFYPKGFSEICHPGFQTVSTRRKRPWPRASGACIDATAKGQEIPGAGSGRGLRVLPREQRRVWRSGRDARPETTRPPETLFNVRHGFLPRLRVSPVTALLRFRDSSRRWKPHAE